MTEESENIAGIGCKILLICHKTTPVTRTLTRRQKSNLPCMSSLVCLNKRCPSIQMFIHDWCFSPLC